MLFVFITNDTNVEIDLGYIGFITTFDKGLMRLIPKTTTSGVPYWKRK